MRNVPNTEALKTLRTVSGRLTLTDTLLRFSNLQASESITIFSEDCDLVGASLLRVAVEQDTNKFWFVQNAHADNGFLNAVWQDGHQTLFPGSRIALFGNRVFYHGSNGIVYYADFSSGAFGAPVSTTISYSEAISIAPVSATEFYIVSFDQEDLKLYMMREVHLHTITGSDTEWEGRLYGPVSSLNIVDAVRFNGADYIYMMDATELRTVYLKKSGNWWSELQPVIPMDIVDNTSSFVLSAVNIINNQVFLTGVLKRTNGVAMRIYMIGPEEFTFGRDLFIRPENIDNEGGKLFLFDGFVWCIGAAFRFQAAQNLTVGVNNPSLTVQNMDILSAMLTCNSEQPNSLQLDIKHDFAHAALIPGAQLVFESCVNGEYAKLGTFGVDGFGKPLETPQVDLTIMARSAAYKRLTQWESDSDFDFWSQTKLTANPGDLTELVRSNGTWKEYNAHVYLDDFNLDSIMYVSANTAMNSFMRAKFMRLSGDFKARFGVGVNYYIESVTEASVRLGVDLDAVTPQDCGNNGIFAIYGDSEYFGTPGISLNLLVQNEWTQLSCIPYVIDYDQDNWIMVKFQDGMIDVYFKRDTTSLWENVISCTFESYDVYPWPSDDYGRGAIYCENVTPNDADYPFLSDSTFIPVHDNSMFPTADEVIVEQERIAYTGKSKNLQVGPLSVNYGRKVTDYEVIGPTVVGFGANRAHSYVVQKLTLANDVYLDAISVYVKKIGFPEDDLKITFYQGPCDPDQPLGNTLGYATVSSDKVNANGGWVTIDFNGLDIPAGNNIWFALARGAGPSAPDPNNYYQTFVGGVPAYVGGTTSTFDEDLDTWTQIAGSVPFILFDNVDIPGQAFLMQVDTVSGLSQTTDFYKDMAIVITEGSGAGNSYRINGYKYGAQTCIFYIDQSASDVLDPTSVAFITPTLIGLTRANSDTIAVAHSDTQVHIYRDRPFVISDETDYYSSEIDLNLEDLVRKIARKAGVLNTMGKNLYPESITPSANNTVIDQTNFMVDLDFGTTPLAAGTVRISGRRQTTSGNGIDVVISSNGLSYYCGNTLRETFPLDQAPQGKMRISYWQNHISIWCCGSFLYTFTITSEDYSAGGTLFTVTGTLNTPINIYIPEASIRVDNYIFQSGTNGNVLLDNLIGEKRFLCQDDMDGNLRIVQSRQDANSVVAPYNLTTQGGSTITDGGLFTRLRVEGSDIAEQFDVDMMIKYGNLYHLANMNEINNPADAAYFANVLLVDIGSRVVSKLYSGAADPKVETNDNIYVATPDGVEHAIVDQVTITMQMNNNFPVFDMSIQGRVARADL